MRHRNIGRQLSRNSSHRSAMLRNLAASILRHEAVKTTLPKAKEDSVAKRRLVFDRIRDREIVTKLFNELGPHYKDRQGGYLRILKAGFRAGDNAPMAYVQLVDRADATEDADEVVENAG